MYLQFIKWHLVVKWRRSSLLKFQINKHWGIDFITGMPTVHYALDVTLYSLVHKLKPVSALIKKKGGWNFGRIYLSFMT